MKINWKLEAPQILLVLGMFVLAALTWQGAPERIPIHWNLKGEVDGYGGKFMGLLFLPLLSAGLYLLLLFIPRLDPGRANYAGFQGAYGLIRIAFMVMLAGIYGVTLLVMRGAAVSMETVVPALVGLLFVVLGGVLGKVRPNWFVGVRTPWTLSSKLSWTKTHRLAGWVFLLTGIVTIVGSLIDSRVAFGALMAGGLGGSLVCVVYSYLVWRNDPEKLAPAGTQPAGNGS